MDEHERIIIGAGDRNSNQSLIYSVQQLADGFSPLTFLVKLDEFFWDVDRVPKLDDGTRPKLVCMEIIHTTGHNLQSTVRVCCQCSQGHDSNTSFERQQFGPIVTTSFWEYSHCTICAQPIKNGVVDLGLIHFGSSLILRTLKAFFYALDTLVCKFTAIIHIVSPGKLSHRCCAFEGFLQSQLLRTYYFCDFRVGGGSVNAGQDQ